MKKYLVTLLLTCFSLASFSQTPASSARSAALRAGLQSGQKAGIEGALNYTDEIRKEVGGSWSYLTTDDEDTVTLATFPGSTTLTSGTSFYDVDVLLKSFIADDTATGTYALRIDSTTISIAVSSVLNPYIRVRGYVYRRSGGQHSYNLDAHITNTTTDSVTVKHFSGNFTRSTGNAVRLKFWPVNLAEADSFQVFTKAALLK